MRILMLNYEYPPLGGGAGNANSYLLKEFAKREDVYVDLVTSSAKNMFEVEKYSEKIRIFKLNVKKKDIHFWKMTEIIRWTLKANAFVKKLLKKNKYDLCHCWFGWPCGLIGYKFRKKVPYIVALRGSDVPGYNPRLKKLDKILFKPLSKIVWGKASAVIANSEGLRKLALRTLDRPIDVIYNGIDISQFKEKEFVAGKKITLISTGRLIERKGYKYLIDALRGLDGFRLVLIGEGDMMDDLKKRALGLDVVFKGAVAHNKIPSELALADVFVLPSLAEGMSNSVLEAMAVGLPVVVTDVGGSRELVRGNGFFIDKRSAKSIKEALVKFDWDMIKEMGRMSRESAERMDWGTVAAAYYKEYQKWVK